jgi:hypothetical protein
MNCSWVLAHPNKVFCRQARCRKVDVRQFGNSVADTFINGACDFATLGMSQRQIHVTGSHCGSQGFEAVGHRKDYIGLEILEHGG